MTCCHKQIDLQGKSFVAMPCFEALLGCCLEIFFAAHASLTQETK